MTWGMLAAAVHGLEPVVPVPSAHTTRRWGWAPDPPDANLAQILPFPYPGGWTVSRERAMAIPAFSRGMDVIAGTIATFRLVELDAAGDTQTVWPIDPYVMRCTVEDLVLHGYGVWQITAMEQREDYPRPTGFAHVDPDRIDYDSVGRMRVDNEFVVELGARPIGGGQVGDVVVFRLARDGALTRGAQSLGIAAALEGAARNYALTPMPQLIVKNNGADLAKDDVKDLLDSIETARRTHTTAYANSAVDLEKVGLDPAAMQLVEARRQAALDCARLLNLDPVWVGAAESGSSLTYTNRTDLMRQLADLTLRPVIVAVERRLSARDVLPGQRRVRFDLDTFLRGNPDQRVQVWQALIGAGVLTVDEVRQLEPLVPGSMGDTT
jgi:hypothetical protein